MSQPQAPKTAEDKVFALLNFPFNTLEAVGSRIVSAFTSGPKRQPTKEPQPAPAGGRIPDVTANLKHMVADRVYSTEVHGRRVSFFQYHSPKLIRITCRELRHLKPIDFTPAIADGAALVYDIDGAIQWVRQNGLEPSAAKRGAAKAPSRASKEAVKGEAPPWAVDEAPAKAKPVVSAALTAPRSLVPAAGNKSAPFTGRIVSFGVVKRNGYGDKKPYETYALKLSSESGSYEKEFIGEHLAELIEAMGLEEGDLVRVQLLGKDYFEVEVNGKMEPRNRNFYAIQAL